MRPAKGAIDPKSIRTRNGPVLADLSGFRESVPTFQGDAQSDGILLDRFDDKIGLTEEEKNLQARIKKEQWTGPTYFLKKLKEPVKRTEQEHDSGGSKPTKSSPSSRGDCSPSFGAANPTGADSDGSPTHGGIPKDDGTGIASSGGLANALVGSNTDEFCGRIAQLKNLNKDDDSFALSDHVIPMAQEDANWEQLNRKVEKVRHSLEELSAFEAEVDTRYAKKKEMLKNGCAKDGIDEAAELAGVAKHSSPPRLLTEYDFREENHYLGRSRRARHR